MSKIVIDENLKGKDLYKFLVENKKALIQQKKSMLKRTDAVSCSPQYFNLKDGQATKAAAGEIPADVSSIRVKVVANTALWVDSQMDCLLPDSAKRSMKERKGLIPHLHDHIHELDAEVGDVVAIYYQDIPLTELGISKQGTAQALIFETDIKKTYNEKVFNKYKAGKVRQHSIGLQYVKIELAVNDEESEKEYDFWNKYYSQLLNPEVADEKGFFWVVPEYKLLENSAVLFGSNALTPTLSVGEKGLETDTPDQPPVGTDGEPSEGSLNIKQLLTIF
jgi:hypothetical protein